MSSVRQYQADSGRDAAVGCGTAGFAAAAVSVLAKSIYEPRKPPVWQEFYHCYFFIN